MRLVSLKTQPPPPQARPTECLVREMAYRIALLTLLRWPSRPKIAWATGETGEICLLLTSSRASRVDPEPATRSTEHVKQRPKV